MCSIFLGVIHKLFLLGENKGPEERGKKLQDLDSMYGQNQKRNNKLVTVTFMLLSYEIILHYQ
jgi:hypothetical protein